MCGVRPSKLGQFKLENVFKEIVFLAPKVYGGITENGEEITKVKGLKIAVSFSDLKSLIAKNESLEGRTPLKKSELKVLLKVVLMLKIKFIL